MTRLLAIPALLAVLSAASTASAAVTVIGIDISTSSPIAYNQGVANNAADYLKAKTLTMQPGDRIRVLSVGLAGTGPREIDLKASISNRAKERPEIIAMQLERFFRSLPAMTKAGKLTPQNATSLIDFLEGFEAHDCQSVSTRIILFTDGLEASHRIKERDLASGKYLLPMPEKRYLDGCDVEIRGVGQVAAGGNSDGLFAQLKPQWEKFLEAAGAREVIITREVGGF